MEFPAINLSVYLKEEYKTSENIFESIFPTQYVYTRDKVFFNFIMQCKFADNRGDIYTVEGFGKVDFWRRIVPLSYRVPVIYKKTFENIGFDEIRNLFAKRLDVLEWEADLYVKKEMYRIVKEAKTLKQLNDNLF